MRLFIALELPEAALEVIGKVQEQLKRAIPDRAVRWVQLDSIHLTLKLLGDVNQKQVAALQEALTAAAAGHRRLNLTIEGLGCFPNSQRPRVIWVGVGGDRPQLAALQDSVEQHIAPLGFPPEGRGFTPHLTLGRTQRHASRDEQLEIGRAVERGLQNPAIEWQAEAVSLIQSDLRPSGAVYTTVYRVGLEP